MIFSNLLFVFFLEPKVMKMLILMDLRS